MNDPTDTIGSLHNARNGSDAPFHQLSIEVWVEILAHLRADKRTLRNCSVTSRTLLGPSRVQLFHTISVQDTALPFRVFNAFISFLRASPGVGPHIRNLTLSNKGSRASVLCITSELLVAMIQSMPGLRTLNIRDLAWIRSTSLDPDARASLRMENLQALAFVFPPRLDAIRFVSDIISCAPALKSLRFGDFSYFSFQSYASQELVLPRALELQDFSFISLGSGLGPVSNIENYPSLHNLHSLELAIDLVRHSQQLGQTLLQYGQRLRSLALTMVKVPGEEPMHLGAARIALANPRLGTFSITYIPPQSTASSVNAFAMLERGEFEP